MAAMSDAQRILEAVVGPVDSAIESALADHLLATLRELLSNVTKHARATAVDIYLRVGVDVSLAVIDNGVGITRE
jgi:signal transduction histidine kinase